MSILTTHFERHSLFYQYLIWFFVWAIMFQLIGATLLQFTLGDITFLLKAEPDSKEFITMTLVQAFILIGTFLLGPMLFESRKNVQPPIKIETNWIHVGLAVFLFIACQPFIQWFQEMNFNIISTIPDVGEYALSLEKQYEEGVRSMLHFKSIIGFLFATFAIAITPAICEEYALRGCMQRYLSKTASPFVAILITSLIFSFIHFSIIGFVSRVILGFLLGWLYHRTQNLLVSIFAHFINNFLVVCAVWLYNLGILEKDPLEMVSFNIVWVITSVLLTFLTLYFFRSKTYSSEEKSELGEDI